MPNVLDDESLYNVVVLDGLASPGKVTLSGHDRKTLWDVQLGPFMIGARMRLKGTPPIEFSASFDLLRDASQGIDDFQTWPAFLAKINSTVVGVKPKALTIYHPDLAANNIKSVVKAVVGGATYPGKGRMIITVKFQEYVPMKVQGGTPEPKPEIDPNQDRKDHVKQLTDQFQATPWG